MGEGRRGSGPVRILEGMQAGILDWATTTAVDLQPVLRTVAVTVAIVFVIYKAVHSKFSLGTIIVSALAAGIFVWLVFNVDQLSDTIGEDLPGGTSSSG
ncbi:hypothetical protein SAMN04515669_3903 [Jiangella sp. DSM 45060]|nr:hypothetical protein SAMN04515669_3903 [Jiangella sp. DSM 45060]